MLNQPRSQPLAGTLAVAAIQLQAGLEKSANLREAERWVILAAQQGAKLIVLPEMFNLYGDLARAAAEAEALDGPTATLLSRLAREQNITLCGGSFAERMTAAQNAEATARRGNGPTVFNTCCVFNPQGERIATYRKIHRFEIDLPGQVTAQESNQIAAGDSICTFTDGGICFGVAICYDLRFPEQFRQLLDQGMQILLLPAAFTKATGVAHWELLVRARAVENQVFVVAANQVGEHAPGSSSYGHSLIVDPWGNSLAQGDGSQANIVRFDLDLGLIEQTRTRLPALLHRRLL